MVRAGTYWVVSGDLDGQAIIASVKPGDHRYNNLSINLKIELLEGTRVQLHSLTTISYTSHRASVVAYDTIQGIYIVNIRHRRISLVYSMPACSNTMSVALVNVVKADKSGCVIVAGIHR